MIATTIMAIIPTVTGWGLTGWGLSAISPEWGGVFNHLWQSTVFAAVAALLAMGLRKNHARARYWLWLAASCKFLVPFSLLVALGVSIGTSIGSGIESLVEKLWPSAPGIVAQPEMTIMFDEISQPFTQVTIPAAAPEHHSMVPELLFGLWACGCAIILSSWFRRWLRVRAAVRAATPIEIDLPVTSLFPALTGGAGEATTEPEHLGRPLWSRLGTAVIPALTGRGWKAPHRIRIMASPGMIEPGIFGIFRPVLLLPVGIADRLTPAQLNSILAHELCHVKRRDNLAAAIHMIVEAAFWFHPLVWWIGARLVEERERACDEEVLRSGSEPGVYAESILQVCKFYLESPLKCVAGVTGSDLKKRIESIMSGLPGRNLSRTRKLLLGAASIGAIAGPVIFGVLAAPHIRAQTQDRAHPAFEVASVKPDKSGQDRRMGLDFLPGGGLSAKGVPLYLLISFAYDLPIRSSRIVGGPDWIRSERFDIEAKADKDAIPPGATVRAREAKTRLMLQTLLADRFKLVIRTEKKELSVYAAVVGKNGPKLQKAKVDEKDCPDTGTTVAGTTCHTFFGGMGRGLHGDAVDMSDLVQFVANWADRPVIDKTGIQGLYNIQTDGWVPMTPSQPSADGTVSDEAQAIADPARPTLQMIFDRLGLKLESQKAPIDMYVIEHAERPSDNFEPPVAAAQAPSQSARRFDGPALSFEVASIKPAPAGTRGYTWSRRIEAGRLDATTTVKGLLMWAYDLKVDSQVAGGPGWLDSDKYVVAAKASGPVSMQQLQQMTRTLLAERFKLTIHRETKEQTVLALVVANKAPKLSPSTYRGDDGFEITIGAGHIKAQGAPMDALVNQLTGNQNRLVVDRTGLTGGYDFNLDWAPDRPSGTAGDRSEPAGPTIFTALQEQLGLKLESAKAPVEIIVIDRVEKPSDNFEPPVGKQGNALHPVAPLGAPQAPPASQQYAGLAIDPKSYVIGVQDVLKITVWREPDLSGAVGVRPDGKITRPLIGEVQAAGLTPARLAAMLQEVYREKIRDPEIIVDVSQVNSKHPSAAPVDAKQEHALHTVAPLSAKPQGQPATPVGKPLAFEVASIRPNKIANSGGEGSRRENISTSPGTLSMSNVTLKSCIKWAYRVQDPQLSAGPDWLTGDRFDVIAKTAGPAPEGQLRLSLQALLADRFKLALHRESKTMAGYALSVGKNGPKLQPSEGEGAPQFRGGNARVEVTGYSMQDLAEFLANPLQTYVANMTGLKGRFDFSIDVLPFLSTDAPIVKDDMASAFGRALELQLGLKLEGRKFPVEVLVIDHAEKPTEN